MILWVGTYESDYPRTRVLVAGLREMGLQVGECHRPVWERDRHKAGEFLAPTSIARAAGRYIGAWSGLLPRAMGAQRPRAVVAGYPAQPDALPAWTVAHRHRAPLVVDMMVSVLDTLAGDRARIGSVGARSAAALDWVALRAADLVLADTSANAAFLVERFRVDPQRVVVVPVGAEPNLFPPSPPPSGPPRALFYGKLSPLHGIETVLAAAREPGVPPLTLVGSGQLGPWLRDEMIRDRPPGLEYEPWIPYESLGDEIARASICLGVFGASDKAARVVPNKVWQAMSAARPVITADTPGIREVLTDGRDALLVRAADPVALADALRRLGGDPDLRRGLGVAARARYLQLGTPRAVGTAFTDALLRVERRR